MAKTLGFILFSCLFLLGCAITQSFLNYKTDTLKIEQITAQSYSHTSYLQTDDFGKVACNGLIVVDNGEAIIFDTPANDTDSKELLDFISNTLNCSVVAVVATHFHNDCLGGLHYFHKQNIPSYSTDKTIEFASENQLEIPKNGFSKQLELKVGDEKVICDFLGEGHTSDNSIGYFSKDKVLFGGCLIKELGAGKGYLGDANTAAWSNTVRAVKSNYNNAEIIVPGHGIQGGQELLDFTIELFE